MGAVHEAATEQEDRQKLAWTEIELGTANAMNGDLLSAEDRYKVGLRQYKTLKDKSGDATTLNNLGDLMKLGAR